MKKKTSDVAQTVNISEMAKSADSIHLRERYTNMIQCISFANIGRRNKRDRHMSKGEVIGLILIFTLLMLAAM